jgi:hypothetical protein
MSGRLDDETPRALTQWEAAGHSRSGAIRRANIDSAIRLQRGKALAGQKITDTSNGLRAMRAQVTERGTLAQAQYQASELLIGALAAGYRVHEVPVIHRRLSGHSKKGPNLRYGYHYAGVLSTWWPEQRRPAVGRREQRHQ